MSTSLPFARFIQLIKVIELLPVPSEIYNRHRLQYDYILGQIHESTYKGRSVSVSELASCSILGSQPTANKRLQELLSYGLIESREGEDRRQKILTVSDLGNQYLMACSDLMVKVVSQKVGQ